MAWQHYKAATESDLYDGRGSYKNIMFRICSLVRKEGEQHAGWCTASEEYLAKATGYSERQVQRAIAQFKQDGVFTVRTFRRGGKEFNHYRPNMELLQSRKRRVEEPAFISESIPGDTQSNGNGGSCHPGGWTDATLSHPTRQVGGVVGTSKKEEEYKVNAAETICRTELRSAHKRVNSAISPSTLSGKNLGDCAPEPPLTRVYGDAIESSHPSQEGLDSDLDSGLGVAGQAARSKLEMVCAMVQRESVPAPPSRERLAPPRNGAAPRPLTPYQMAKALGDETKKTAWDTYLRAYSLAHQFAGYLEERAARGEKAYAFDHWEVLYTADFIDALHAGWKFKDIEDAIDVAQTTKFRFICCTPRRLLDNGESLMKAVHASRRKGTTIRQKLGERYPSWYLENAGSVEIRGQESAVHEAAAKKERELDEQRRRDLELDADVPISTLKTTGRIRCINPECQ